MSAGRAALTSPNRITSPKLSKLERIQVYVEPSHLFAAHFAEPSVSSVSQKERELMMELSQV